MELSSRFYRITEGSKFRQSLKDFDDTESQLRDIQKLFNRLDSIGQKSGRWLFQKKLFVHLGNTSRNSLKCKAYVPITSQRMSAMKGSRLYLAVKPKEQEVLLLQIIRKSKIAGGSKKDLSSKKEQSIFDE